MSLRVDEDEHSIEMHLPYVRKVFAGIDIKIVPILVGAIDKTSEAHFGAALAPYLAKPDTICVVSSDFCHCTTPPVKLSRSTRPEPDHPIHQSITALDRAALDILTLPSPAPGARTAAQTHEAFAAYLRETQNTICGRHPIGVLLGALAEIEKANGEGRETIIKWVRYEQSSACVDIRDSSVSYASAYVVF
ncbi:hypothetical protein FRC10_003647 [Ceratobasidium sp. 414]|nr:hypothetical protein FRC10_003647 [Ceratobasidium sp. 414]